jgi:hypothetical protein
MRKKKKIMLPVVVCNLCGFSVTRDPIGLDAMGSHYGVDHKGVEFNDWGSMHTGTMTLPSSRHSTQER